MPVGPYRTFGECVKEQMLEGYSRAAAERICGALEKETKRKSRRRDTKAMFPMHEGAKRL
jgi:hypothetical protein